jgi:hypothetical protein
MDDLEKAQQIARIKLMLEIQNRRRNQTKQRLIEMALELIQAGNNKQEIISILTARENLSPEEIKVLEGILSAVG